MKEELIVYASSNNKFEKVYENDKYVGVLQLVPCVFLEEDKVIKLTELFKCKKLKLTIEVEEE